MHLENRWQVIALCHNSRKQPDYVPFTKVADDMVQVEHVPGSSFGNEKPGNDMNTRAPCLQMGICSGLMQRCQNGNIEPHRHPNANA